MMAKMFYTLEEAQTALGKNEEEIKQFAREGRLREFRDGPRLMFKADQVEQLKSEMAGGMQDHVDLGTSDSGGLIGLVDTGSGGPSGTGITMADADTGQSSQAGMRMKDDTALAADLGLSGSMGGVPSPGRPASSGTGLSGTATGRQSGINVFGAEDVERVDPSAQTAISGAIREQVNLEGVGSGSGLLDLTRESDDTSLGAVLDEIAPSARLSPSDVNDAAGSGSGTGLEDATMSSESTPVRGSAAAGGPVYIQSIDPAAAAFGAAALFAALAMLFGAYVLIAALVGTHPQATTYFADKNPLMPALFGLGGVIIFFVTGLLVGKAMARS
jgi:hypothetical protein